MLEKQHALEVEQAIETSRCLPPPSIYTYRQSAAAPGANFVSYFLSDASCPMRAIANAALC